MYLALSKPGRWNDTSITLSTVANLSDRSFVSRLDLSVVLLTHMTFEAYLSGHYGREGGEFRFGAQGVPILDLGLAVRMDM